MWLLDEYRMSALREHGIANQRLQELHSLARGALDMAEQAAMERRYDRLISASRNAWGYESRAYPDVQGTATDVVKGVLFYLAMLLPFAYFGERLLFSFPDIKRQIAGTAGVFIVVFVILRWVHPAFELSITPLIILLAFIILALAIVVIGVVTTKFNEQLLKMTQEAGGVHEADVGRISAAATAFALGIANMRRRKARTGLTCATLTLLTFTVLSFTSVKTYLRPNRITLRREPCYPGIMLRDRVWSPLEEPTYMIVENELSGKTSRGSNHTRPPGGTEQTRPVSPRAWYSPADIEQRIYVDIRSGVNPSKVYAANVLLGLSAKEPPVTGVDKTLLPGGRWFRPGERDSCILPQSMANELGIGPQDVGSATVIIFGTRYRVVGLVDDQRFASLRDLDGEPLTPVDYAMLRPEVIEEVKRQAAQRFKLGTSGLQSLLQEYKHFLPGTVAILPFETVMDLGGTLRSIAIRYGNDEDVLAAVDDLMKRFALSLYTGSRGRTYLYSSIGTSSLSGLEGVAVPILIAALIVLNTMLGSVYERVKEIGIYSAVGLAPIHIAMLFLAEASVFANIGAIVGYLIGQILSKVLMATGHGAGISLNYSSTSAVGVTIIVVAVVLLSTIYPAKRASEIAMPGIERKWRLPEPEGELMRLELPFRVTGPDAVASCAFLKEFFDAYVGYAGGDFLAENVRLERVETERGPGIAVRLRMWLAPYDLGVSQDFDLQTVPTGEGEIYEIHLMLRRQAGDISSWKKTNWLFLNALRKQFLIWRTVPVAAKREYETRGRAVLADDSAQEAA